MNYDLILELNRAAGELSQALPLEWEGEPASDKNQRKIRRLVERYYGSLKQAVDERSFWILAHLHDVERCDPFNLLLETHTTAQTVQGSIREVLNIPTYEKQTLYRLLLRLDRPPGPGQPDAEPHTMHLEGPEHARESTTLPLADSRLRRQWVWNAPFLSR